MAPHRNPGDFHDLKTVSENRVFHGAGPSAIRNMGSPENYETSFPDVGEARRWGVILDPDLHFSLYGHHQGRHFLARLKDGINNVIFISPSHGKQCGIGEYGRYLSGQFEAMGETVHVARTSSAVRELDDAFLDRSLVIINHGPGLFDGLNPRLSQGESTTQLLHNLEVLGRDKGCIPIIIHHSLLDTDHHLLYSRQNQILQSGITEVSFVSSGARNFFLPALELGISPVAVPGHDYSPDRDLRPEVIGFFGFYQHGGKDFDSLFHLAKELRGRVVGSVVTSSPTEADKLETSLVDAGIDHDFGQGWVTDDELMARLLQADYFYLPQNDYDHWNNSATARFVTNLDRPLFLPPHQPFLDMADGAIFATKDDLPRIAAYVREPHHYDKAVARVRGFRKRAQMSNTARILRHDVIGVIGDMSRTLLLGTNETSYERYLELGPDGRKDFAGELGVPEAGVATACRALYRAPAPKQFWRKHYELGDLIFPTLLESLHAIFMAICKRVPGVDEIDQISASSAAGTKVAEALHKAILLALKQSGTTFNSHDIVLLDNGALVDWQAHVTPERIEAFATAKRKRQAAIATEAKTLEPSPPAITNVLELLILPADQSRARPAPVDLSRLDLDWVCAAPSLVARFGRLAQAFTDADLNMVETLVFDTLQPAAIDVGARDYAVEDFVYLDGDTFLINAMRCIDKRDLLPIEAMVLQSFLAIYGKLSLLRHLLDRGGRKVRIAGLDSFAMSTVPGDFARFIQNMRDPLFGLIDRRNAYEIQRRQNQRWWLANHVNNSKLWNDGEQNMQKLVLTYGVLDASVGRAEAFPLPGQKIARYITKDGLFLNFKSLAEHCHAIPLDGWMQISTLRNHPAALRNFHEVETEGAWSNGTDGLICLTLLAPDATTTRVADAASGSGAGGMIVRLDMGFVGSGVLGPRLLKAIVSHNTNGTGAWIDVEAEVEVRDDSGLTLMIPCDALRIGANIVIGLKLSASTSPQKLGMSTDDRELGAFVRRVGVFSSRDT